MSELARRELSAGVALSKRRNPFPDGMYDFKIVDLDEALFNPARIMYLSINNRDTRLFHDLCAYFDEIGIDLAGKDLMSIGGLLYSISDELKPEEVYKELCYACSKSDSDFIYREQFKDLPVMIFLTPANFAKLEKSLGNVKEK